MHKQSKTKLYHFSPALFIMLFFIVLILSIKIMLSSQNEGNDSSVVRSEKKYHLGLFLPVEDHTLHSSIIEGVNNSAESLDCAISLFSLYHDREALSMTPYMGFDGVIVFPFGDLEYLKDVLSRLTSYNIPVIQLENELIRDTKTFFIGSNNYETGRSIGKIVDKIEGDLLNVIMIYSDKSPGLKSASSLVEMGFRSVVGKKLGEFHTYSTTINPLDGERLAYEIVRETPETDVIVLSDPIDTVVAVQAIIDNNLVGDVHIVGFGDSPIIREYIDKGVIQATVVRDYNELGSLAVQGFIDMKTTGYFSANINTQTEVVYSGR